MRLGLDRWISPAASLRVESDILDWEKKVQPISSRRLCVLALSLRLATPQPAARIIRKTVSRFLKRYPLHESDAAAMLRFWLCDGKRPTRSSSRMQSFIQLRNSFKTAIDSIATTWHDMLTRFDSASVQPIRQLVGLQPLEQRVLLSSIALTNQTLTLAGDSSQSNTIFVLAGANNTIIASVDGNTQTFNSSAVSSIVINGGDARNTIIESTTISTPTTVSGGSSGDYISVPHTASVNGNGGSDTIFIDLAMINADVWNATGVITGSNGSSGGSTSSGSGSSSSSSSSGSSSSSSSSSSGGSSSGSTSSGSSSTGGSTSTTGSSSGNSSSSGSTSTSSGSGSSGSTSSSGSSGSGSAGSTSSGGATSGGTTSSGSQSSGGTTTPPGNLHPVITITAGQNLLPGQSVHVQAVNSNFGSGTVLTDQIRWEFGDAGAAYDQMVGFNAAHAYDHPGTYTVTLTLITPNGGTATSTAQVIVAQDTRPILYVSASGNDANNGSSPSQAIKSIARANQLLGSNMQVLFHDGDTFTTSDSHGLNILGWHNVTVSSYGTGAQPIIMYNGPQTTGAMISLQPGTTNLVVQGLTFDSTYVHSGNTKVVPWAIGPTGDNITIRDNTFLNVEDGVMMSSVPSDVLIQDNSAPDPQAINAYFIWAQGNDIAIVGNNVTNTVGESSIRIGGADRVLVADNNVNNIKKGSIAVQEGTYAYVYANTINSGPVGMGPIGSLNASPNNSFQYGVFDSNITHNVPIVFQPGAHNVLARNNVVYNNGNSGFLINAQQISTNSLGQQINWQVQNVTLLNNTVIDNVAMGGFLTVANGIAQNIVMDNNLFVDPNYQTGAGQGLVQVDNNNLTGFTEIKDNVWAIPRTSNWTLGGYFYVNLHGGVQAGYLTPAEWTAMGVPQGDVYVNVTLGSTYSYSVNGFVAGSNLPTGS